MLFIFNLKNKNKIMSHEALLYLSKYASIVNLCTQYTIQGTIIPGVSH